MEKVQGVEKEVKVGEPETPTNVTSNIKFWEIKREFVEIQEVRQTSERNSRHMRQRDVKSKEGETVLRRRECSDSEIIVITLGLDRRLHDTFEEVWLNCYSKMWLEVQGSNKTP